MKSPETIYLIPGEQIEGLDDGLVWSEDPAPSYADEADEAVKYVRFDHIPDVRKMMERNREFEALLIEGCKTLAYEHYAWRDKVIFVLRAKADSEGDKND